MAVFTPNVGNDARLPYMEDKFRLAVRAFIIWTQGIFSTRPPGQWRWRDNAEESEVLIQGVDADAVPQNNQVPRITVSHTGGAYAGASIGQTQQYPFGNVTDTTFSDLVQTSVIFEIQAMTAAEASEIAFILFCLYPVFRVQLNKMADLHQVQSSISVRPPARTASMGCFNVVVVVPIAFQVSVRASDDQLHAYIRGVNLAMQTILGNTNSTP